MVAFYAFSYLAIGLVCAGVTLAAVVPQPGFRPAPRWVLAGVVCFTLLWPFLVMLAMAYLLGLWYNRPVAGRTNAPRIYPIRRFTYRKVFDETAN